MDRCLLNSSFGVGGRPGRSQTLENPQDLDPLFMSVHVYISKEHYCGLELSQQGRAMKIMGFDSNGSWDSSQGCANHVLHTAC